MDDVCKFSTKHNCRNVNELKVKKHPLVQNLIDAITDKKKKYLDKANSLAHVWNQYSLFINESSSKSLDGFEELLIHTLKLVLIPDWTRVSGAVLTHLRVALTTLTKNLKKSRNYSVICKQCSMLLSLIEKPWDHHAMLNEIFTGGGEVLFDDILEFFQLEHVKVIIVRLEMLLESKCEDIAARLSKAFLLTYYGSEELELDANQEEIDYLTDIYYFSMYKDKKLTDLTNEIRQLQLEEGLHLLKRYRYFDEMEGGFGNQTGRNCKEARIWKNSKKLIAEIADGLLANAFVQDYLIDDDTIFLDLISEWAVIRRPNENEDALKKLGKLVLNANSSKCLYLLSSFFVEHCPELPIQVVTDCLVRAINEKRNEIEKYRVGKENDLLIQTYHQLSQCYVLISKVFKGFTNIHKECLLTVFSLTPSKESLEQLESFVEKMALNTDELKSNDELLSTAYESESNSPFEIQLCKPGGTDENLESKYNANIQEHTPSRTSDSAFFEFKESTPPYCAEVFSLDLDEDTKSDLNGILRYQRFHKLSWELEWNELKANCVKYLEIFENRGYRDVELKFLDIDYNQYKDRPINEDDYYGIEKGYEQYVVYTDAEEYEQENFEYEIKSRKRKKSLSSDDERKPKTKKRKKSHQEQRGMFYEEFSDDDELLQYLECQVPNESNTPVVNSEKKNKKSRNSILEVKSSKKRDRPRSIDSQSENQPPDDVVSETVTDKKKMRITLKPFNSEENKVSENDDMMFRDAVMTENDLPAIKISLAKCDTGLKTVKREEGEVENSQVRNPKDKRPRPRSTALAVQKCTEEFIPHIDDKFICEVRLQKSNPNGYRDMIEEDEVRKHKLKTEVKMNLQDELQALLSICDMKSPLEPGSNSVNVEIQSELRQSIAKSIRSPISSQDSITYVEGLEKTETTSTRASSTTDDNKKNKSVATPKKRGRPKGVKNKICDEDETKERRKEKKQVRKRIKQENMSDSSSSPIIRKILAADTSSMKSYKFESRMRSLSPTLNSCSYSCDQANIANFTANPNSSVNIDMLPSSSTNTNHVYVLLPNSQYTPSPTDEILSNSTRPKSTLEDASQLLGNKNRVVEEILGKYQNIIDTNPELRDVPAARNRTCNGTSKRTRKSKTNPKTKELSFMFSNSMPANQNSAISSNNQQSQHENQCHYNSVTYNYQNDHHDQYQNISPALTQPLTNGNSYMVEQNGNCRIYQTYGIHSDIPCEQFYENIAVNNMNSSDCQMLPSYSCSEVSSQTYNSDYVPNGSVNSFQTNSLQLNTNNTSIMNGKNFYRPDSEPRYREKFHVEYHQVPNSEPTVRCHKFVIPADCSEMPNLNDSFSSSEGESEISMSTSMMESPFIVYHRNNNQRGPCPLVIDSPGTTTISIPEHNEFGDDISLGNLICLGK